MKMTLSLIIIIFLFLLGGEWLRSVDSGASLSTPDAVLVQDLLKKVEQLSQTKLENVPLTMLLEVEILRRASSLEGELLLRQSLAAWSRTSISPKSSAQVQKLLFSPDGQWLASSQMDNTVQLWHYDAAAQSQFSPITTWHHEKKITALTFSPDNKWLVSSGEDGMVYIWSLNTSELTKQQFYQEAIESLAFSPNGQWLVIGSHNQVAYLWPLAAKTVATRRLSHPAAVNMAQFSPDGYWLATVSQSEVQAWEMLEVRQVWQMPHEQAEAVTSLTFSPNNQWLATADWTGEVHLWALHPTISTVRLVAPQIQVPRIQHEPNFWTKTAFSYDSQFLAVSGGNSVKVWQLAASFGELTVNLTPTALIQHQDWVTQITFNSQRNWLISASLDGTVQVWDMQAQQLFNQLSQPFPVLSFALHPNNLVVATASGSTIQLWHLNGPDNPLTREDLINSACRQLPRKSLTGAEWQQYFGAEPYRATC